MEKTLLTGAGILLIGVLAGVLITQSFTGSWWGPMMHHNNYETRDIVTPGAGMRNGNTGGMGMMHDSMFIRSERAFIEHMIPHHEEAIATAGEVLERGGTTEGMVALANNIINSQTAEVASMKEWYQEWFSEPYRDTGEYEPMMRDLAPYSGRELDRIFLHDMIMHHMGAIMSARMVTPHLEHDALRELTSNIIVNQSEEIQTMEQLFRELENQ